MSTDRLEKRVRTFKRQLSLIALLQVAGVGLLVVAVVWAARLSETESRRAMLLVGATGMLVFLFMIINAVRLNADLRTGGMLLTAGHLDDAEAWFQRAIERFSLSARAKIIACQQLAAVFFRRNAYDEVVTICRELLRHRIRHLKHVWINARLLLADSLLMLNRADEAYEALRPVYDAPLSLAERMKLLPIQLRYELDAGHTGSATRALAEKVQIAELLESPRAALVHALLAEACRREAMTAECDFLTERAWLYCDLDKLADRYTVIAPIARHAPEPVQ